MSYPHTEMFHGISYTDVLVGEITIAIMDLISIRIKAQFKEKFGLFPPSYIYAKICAKEILNENEMITSDIKAVQIHYINGHYLISCQLPPNIYVFDSLKHYQRINELMPQLQLVYASVSNQTVKQKDIKYIVLQSQGVSVDCGAFSVANVISLLHNTDPSNIIFHQNQLRSHIFQSLYGHKFLMFPHSVKNSIDKTSDVLINNREKPHQCWKTVGKRKKNTIEPTLRENRAEPYEQENNDEKAKQILEEKCAKRAKNAQQMREKRARQTDEEKCKERAKETQRMREKRARQTDEEKHTRFEKCPSNERDEGQTNS